MSFVHRLVALALFVAGLVVLPAAAAAAAVPTSWVTMEINERVSYGGTLVALWRSDVHSVSARGDGSGGAVVELRNPANASKPYDIALSAGPGASLAPGTYEAAQGSDGTAGPMARIDGWGTATSYTCGTKWGGTFTVNDVAADLSRLSVTYRLTCGLEATANGEIRINSPADPELLVAADSVAFPDRYPGKGGYSVGVTLINTGAADVTVTDVAVTGGAADFHLLGEGQPICPSIPIGGSCAFDVGFTPAAAGARTGTVTITDSTSAGVHTVRLTGTGIGGHTFWGTHTQVDDPADEYYDRAIHPPDNASMFAAGDAQKVDLVLREHSWNTTYDAQFRGSPDKPLLPGTTHTNGLEVTNWGSCASPTGKFTVHEAAYDEKGAVTKFSVTFEQHCEGRIAGTYGSIAWRADNPPQPVGGIVGVVPDAVVDLTAVPAKGSVALSWGDVPLPDWATTIVRGAEGTKAPATPTSGFAVYSGKAGKATAKGLRSGVTYSFSAFRKDTEGLISPRKSVTAYGSKLTATATKTRVAYGDRFTLSGRLTNMRSGGPIAGGKVKVYAVHVRSGEQWLLGTATTGPRGYYNFPFNPAATFRYRAEYGGGQYMGAVSNRVDVQVAMRVEIGADRRAVRLGTTFRIGTRVYPPNPGEVVRLQKLTKGKWVTIAKKPLFANRATIFTVPAPGRYTARYRAVTPGDGYRLAGRSKVVEVTGYV